VESTEPFKRTCLFFCFTGRRHWFRSSLIPRTVIKRQLDAARQQKVKYGVLEIEATQLSVGVQLKQELLHFRL
jgi:hypothetical protein